MNDETHLSTPTLRPGVGFRRIFDEGVALVAATSKVNVLNEPACRFLELVDGKRTTEEILSLLESEYDAPAAAIRRDVTAFLAQAVAAGLIELRQTRREV